MNAEAGDSSRWRRRADVLHRRTLAGTVVLAPGESEPRLLSDAAAIIWDLLKSPRSSERIVSLTESNGATAPDVHRLLRELEREGLVAS